VARTFTINLDVRAPGRRVSLAEGFQLSKLAAIRRASCWQGRDAAKITQRKYCSRSALKISMMSSEAREQRVSAV